MPLDTPTVLTPRLPRLGRVAALAAVTCAAAGALTIVIADDQPVPPLRSIAEPSRPATPRYLDLEANKAAAMRALGHHDAGQQANRPIGFTDLAANKAASMRALGNHIAQK